MSSRHFRRTRRFLLATAGALCLPPSFASTAPGRPAPRSLIDVHHHWDSPELRRWWARATSEGEWKADRALAAMDESGVGTAFLSITQPGVWKGSEADGSVSLARRCNEAMAMATQDHSGRFGFFATVALPMVAASVAEIGFSLDSLKADGVGLLSSYEGKYLGDSVFEPVFDELNRRRSVVYVHPTVPSCCAQVLPDVPATGFEEPSDTTRTIESLLYSGALARWSEIRFVFAHGGGSLPFLADRIMSAIARSPQAQAEFLSSYNARAALSRLYFDCASVVNPAAWAALMNFTSPDRILFGSDYPYHTIGAALGGLRAMEQRSGLAPAEVQSIESTNGRKLFASRARTA